MADAFTIAANLRVASLSIAIFHFAEVLPRGWRLVRDSRGLSITSICVLTVSNVGFFYPYFTVKSCDQFYLLPPIFKVIQAMVAQAILGLRQVRKQAWSISRLTLRSAYNLSRRSRLTSSLLALLYTAACTSPTVGVGRYSSPPDTCRAVSDRKVFGAWVYYALAMIYDLSTTAICMWFLLQYRALKAGKTRMVYDGMSYFVVLTGVNILNLIFYRTDELIQTAGSSLGYALNWIMSMKLLLHLHESPGRTPSEDTWPGPAASITFTRPIDSMQDRTHALRSLQSQKRHTALELSAVPEDDAMYKGHSNDFEMPEQVDVEVHIERTVRIEHRPAVYALEDYTRAGRQSMQQSDYI
ncbi:uncharacterized protein SCHCODRAFT_01098598 [Schizophyllum commune H4-8]|uniref:Uncharacterized protein n=1 Tax=Schizophyllum commune (strain H4-8 / FGSC 9210) TaxID=578458 RepID=D8Q9H4_SCHCM|nr:uncharacterized protein SCHCODRAFT_01098598 [Schizophyllum commune H4-8]KAI5890413.1 hypothetical protein SCHCODRAFT_01098598 [Schizophyllum commune H4-8]